jgi:hypothetical protein
LADTAGETFGSPPPLLRRRSRRPPWPAKKTLPSMASRPTPDANHAHTTAAQVQTAPAAGGRRAEQVCLTPVVSHRAASLYAGYFPL